LFVFLVDITEDEDLVDWNLTEKISHILDFYVFNKEVK
jgi:hypothetical protein